MTNDGPLEINPNIDALRVIRCGVDAVFEKILKEIRNAGISSICKDTCVHIVDSIISGNVCGLTSVIPTGFSLKFSLILCTISLLCECSSLITKDERTRRDTESTIHDLAEAFYSTYLTVLLSVEMLGIDMLWIEVENSTWLFEVLYISQCE